MELATWVQILDEAICVSIMIVENLLYPVLLVISKTC